MKVSNYLVEFFASQGVTHAFGMSGGAAVHIFDSINSHPKMEIVSMTHEQCAAMAADGYARATGRTGLAVTTSGPGATNLLTGTCCSYYDSIPVVMLTGQVATHRLKGRRRVRQIGFQETDVVSIFSSVTKYAVQLTDPTSIRYHLEKAFYLANEGRPGPVLLDIPDDLQRLDIDAAVLEGFPVEDSCAKREDFGTDIDRLLYLIKAAERPVVILGGGLKTPSVGHVLVECLEKLNIPALVTWAGLDLLAYDHPLRVGTFGVYGPRCGNFVVQNADLVIALGTRLSQNLTGGILSSFAREATICIVDTDVHELKKFDGTGINVKHPIHAPLLDFLKGLAARLKSYHPPEWIFWKQKIIHWKSTFKIERSPKPDAINCVDAYNFIDALTEKLEEDELVYVDTGGNLTWTCNGLRPKRGQRIISAWNNTPMGYSLPAAIGAAFGHPAKRVTCIIGDGGLMICLAELATVSKHKLPLKIFLFNNHCHGIQRQTLETWLEGRYVGVDPSSGVAFPSNFNQVAIALGMRTFTIADERTMRQVLEDVYADPGPTFVNVEINPNQKLFPVLKFGSALEDQLPALGREKISEEMIVPPFDFDTAPLVAKKQSSQGW